MSDYAKPDVLVDTDWVETHGGDDGVRLIEVDEDSAAYDKGHIEGAVGWNWTTDLHTKVGREYVSPGRAGRAAVGRGRRTGHDRRPVRRQQQLVRGLRLLDPEAARVRQREAAERRAEEVGARVPPAHAGRAELREHRHLDPGCRPSRRSGPGATRSSPRSARSVWSTCAHRRSTAARSSRPTTSRRSSRRFPGTSPERRTSRG